MFVKNKRDLVIDCYPPGRVRLLWLTILLALVALAWALWVYAPARVDAERADAEQRRVRLQERLAAVERERADLQAEVRQMRAMKGVDEGAYRLLRQNYDALQLQLVEIQEQLAFYQTVVGPAQAEQPVKVQRFRIEPDGDDYRYSLVVVRAQKGEGSIKGSLRLRIQGADRSGARSLAMDEVTRPAVQGQKLGFRYFQNISGVLRLPAGFVPHRVELTLDLGQSGEGLVRSYSWSQLQG